MCKRERPPLAKAAGSVAKLCAFRIPTENRHSCPSCIGRDEHSALFANELRSEQSCQAVYLTELQGFCAERRMHFERKHRALGHGRIDVDFADLEAIRRDSRLLDEAARFLAGIPASLAAGDGTTTR